MLCQKKKIEESSNLVKGVTKIIGTNNHLNNVENEVLTNMLFQDLMSKKSLVMHSTSNLDLDLDLDVYEEVVLTTPQKDSSNSEISNHSDLSPDTTKWLQSNIDQVGPSRQLVNYEVSSDSVNDVQQLVDSDDTISCASGVIGQVGIRKKNI